MRQAWSAYSNHPIDTFPDSLKKTLMQAIRAMAATDVEDEISVNPRPRLQFTFDNDEVFLAPAQHYKTEE